MKTGSSKALVVATAVAAVALGTVAWLDAGKCNGFEDWAEHALFFFEDETVWAEDYSEEGFRKIEPGMTCEEVVRLAGRPLYEWWSGEGSECLGRNVNWDYAWPGGAGWVRRVYFEEDGRTVNLALRDHVRFWRDGMAIWNWELGWLPWVLLAGAVVACFFRQGRRIVAWTVVGAVLLAAGGRLAREAGNVVRGRGVGALERAGWRWVGDEAYVRWKGWSRTYDVGAEGMSRGWVGLTAWVPEGKKADQPFRGKLRLEWLDGEGRTVRESVVGAGGPEGLAFSPPAGGREGPTAQWVLPLERFDAAWVAAGGLQLRMTVEERDGEMVEFDEEGLRQVARFCVWMVK